MFQRRQRNGSLNRIAETPLPVEEGEEAVSPGPVLGSLARPRVFRGQEATSKPKPANLSTILVIDDEPEDPGMVVEAQEEVAKETTDPQRPVEQPQIPTVEEDMVLGSQVGQFTIDTLIANIEAERRRNESLLQETTQVIALVSSSEKEGGRFSPQKRTN